MEFRALWMYYKASLHLVKTLTSFFLLPLLFMGYITWKEVAFHYKNDRRRERNTARIKNYLR